ncbi:hypothetical protein BJL95_05475 [Methylomonas sp. LWB]|uniref:Uncharacterized protein n=1 Tax=Methylomonas koyamae TaxID=702114 RepID=A0A177NA19_9GAMM|nr:hypothetical protein A1355_12895 [Methylomonas koyamae]OHX37474.1 hypothetical protein BJL95_05475 [Methylomonas sp. LWB]
MVETARRRFASCLIVSLLIHLGLASALTDIFRPRKPADRLPDRLAVLPVEFKILHLAENGRDNQSPPSLPAKMAGGRSRAQPKPAPILTASPRQAINVAPRTDKSANPAHPEPPKLDLSKVLNDVRQVARESAEHNGEQKFDRRKLAVNPENLHAPDSGPKDVIETYTLPNGYQRRCAVTADGKKQCMSKEADDDGIWNAKIYVPDSLPSDGKSVEFARRLQQAVGKH